MVGADGTGSTSRLLLSSAGQELLGQLSGIDIGAGGALALAESLRRRYPAGLVAAALSQQALRFAARAKFRLADQMLFTRAGLEQASSELTARHAAARFAGAGVVADFCCGIGGTLTALASDATTQATDVPPTSRTTLATGSGSTNGPLGALEHTQWAIGRDRDRGAGPGRRVIAVDLDVTSLEFARHNASVYAPGSDVGFVRADATWFPLAGVDAVYIDPARRDGERRLPAGQGQPPLRWCLRLAEAVRAVGIKTAPGVRRDQVPAGWEAEFVAVGRDLKEALLWSPALATTASRATVLPSGDTLAARAAGPAPTRLAAPGAFLLDPSPAITRAGLVTDLADLVGAWQIDAMIAFLSCDQPARTPFARTLRVLESAPWHEKRFARRLRELGIGSADIRRRGLAGEVARIHQRLGLRGGGAAATLVLTRVNDRPWGLICAQLDA